MRPLIVFTPKSMLRNKAAVSDIRDFTEQKFRSVLEEPTYTDGDGDRTKVRWVLLTSGKLYYELAARKTKDNRDGVAIVRIEQLAPPPRRRLAETLDRCPTSKRSSGCRRSRPPGVWPRFGLELPELLSGQVGRPQADFAAGHRRRRRARRRCTRSNGRKSSMRPSPNRRSASRFAWSG